MEKFTKYTSVVIPIDRSNVDTDAIIPKQFLKSVERSGFGDNLFDAWRYLDQGEPGEDCCDRPLNPDFILNQKAYREGKVLLARENPVRDGAVPSWNSVATLNLFRLAGLTSKPEYETRALQNLGSQGAVIQQQRQVVGGGVFDLAFVEVAFVLAGTALVRLTEGATEQNIG